MGVLGGIAALAGTVGSWLGIGEKRQMRNQKNLTEHAAATNYKYGEMAADASAERTLDLYNKTESPQARVEQLKEAGIPASMALAQGSGIGTGGARTSAQGGGASGQQAGAAPRAADSMMMGLTFAKLGAETQLLKAQAKNLNADTTKKSGVDTELGNQQIENLRSTKEGQDLANTMQGLDNQIKEMTMQYEIAEAKSQAEYITRRSTIALEDYAQKVIQTELDEATKKEKIKQAIAATANQQAEATLKLAQGKYTEAQKDALAVQLQQGWAQIALNKESNENVAQRIIQDKEIWGEQREENKLERANKILTAPLTTGAYLTRGEMKKIWPDLIGLEY